MDQNDTSCEPMEIDLSGQSVNAMDISCDFTDDGHNSIVRPCSPKSNVYSTANYQPQLDKSFEQTAIKYCHIKLKRPSRGFKKTIFKISFAVLVTFVSISTYYINILKCCDELNFKVLNETLSKRLYGQSIAANLLIETLEIKTSNKILFFSGGTGVGKTLTSSLLLDFIGPCSNVYHYTMPTFESTFSPEMMFGVTLCKSSIVIVDDVTVNNMYLKEQIKNLILKTKSLRKELTVILIYNCNDNHEDYYSGCDKLFNDIIMEDFSEVQVLKKIIQFEPLSMTTLKKCIVQELGNRKLNDQEFEALLKHFNVSVDGCKSVHSKMKYLNIL